MDNTQLPAEVVEEIKAEAKSYAQNFTFPHFWDEDNEEFALPVVEQVYEEIATEYATKLLQLEQEIESLTRQLKDHAAVSNENMKLLRQENQKARALLEKFIEKFDRLYEWKNGLYNEIKTFLDGTK
jgi:glutaredoxin 2